MIINFIITQEFRLYYKQYSGIFHGMPLTIWAHFTNHTVCASELQLPSMFLGQFWMALGRTFLQGSLVQPGHFVPKLMIFNLSQEVKEEVPRKTLGKNSTTPRRHMSSRRRRRKKEWKGKPQVSTVLIGYYDYHPVTKSPKIGRCDYSQMSF